jgi:pentatricopeptide repeat protein
VTLYEWLLAIGHQWDDRLCTTLIRVCSQHGQAAQALQLYEWMRRPWSEGGRGGAGLTPTVFTYTAVMRAALSGNMVDRAYQVCPGDL